MHALAARALVASMLLSVLPVRVDAECQTCTIDNAHSGHCGFVLKRTGCWAAFPAMDGVTGVPQQYCCTDNSEDCCELDSEMALLYAGLAFAAVAALVTLCICMCCSPCPLFKCWHRWCCYGDNAADERRPLNRG